MKTKFWLTAATATAIMSSTAMTATAEESKLDREKCYGVAAVAKNDCAASSGKHSCAGQATVGGSGEEWIYLPKGTCERLNGGSLQPISGTAPAAPAAKEEPKPVE